MDLYQLKVDGQVIPVCPTTYVNIRELLTEFVLRDAVPPGRLTKHYSKYVRELCLKIWKEGKKSV